MIRRIKTKTRPGFTLIELLVAMALTMFIMVILTQAFTTSMDTFRELKGIGDMERNLRTATSLLRSDLQLDHFEGKRRLSDPGFWNEPTREGFFRIWQGNGSTNEGIDADGLPSWYAVNQRLHFTIKRRGNKREHFMTAAVPSSSPLIAQQTDFFGFPNDSRFADPAGRYFTSPWAEVAYFLQKTGTTTDPLDPNNTTGTPLFSLYRVQKLLVPDTSVVNGQNARVSATPQNISAHAGISFSVTGGNSPYLRFNDPTDVTTIALRGINVTNPSTAGASLVLTNVVNFNVQSLGGNPWVLPNPTLNPAGNGSSGDRNFDTAPGSPQQVISGVQIILRVWDQKTEQARQVTVIQDL